MVGEMDKSITDIVIFEIAIEEEDWDTSDKSTLLNPR